MTRIARFVPYKLKIGLDTNSHLCYNVAAVGINEITYLKVEQTRPPTAYVPRSP